MTLELRLLATPKAVPELRHHLQRYDHDVRLCATERALPLLLRATVTDEHGRGMALLDALARRWGVEQGADRKTVWCELEGLNSLAGRGC